jgi:hypothetical protein
MYFYIKFHIHSSKDSFVIAVNLNAKWKLLHGCHIVVSNSTKRLPQQKYHIIVHNVRQVPILSAASAASLFRIYAMFSVTRKLKSMSFSYPQWQKYLII